MGVATGAEEQVTSRKRDTPTPVALAPRGLSGPVDVLHDDVMRRYPAGLSTFNGYARSLPDAAAVQSSVLLALFSFFPRPFPQEQEEANDIAHKKNPLPPQWLATLSLWGLGLAVPTHYLRVLRISRCNGYIQRDA